jgi:tetratricopeptide (TPR) repeat protein
MSESSKVLAFYSNLTPRAAKVRLQLAEEHRGDMPALADCYRNALDTLKLCHDTGAWDYVLHFMSALEEFLHKRGHWREACASVTYTKTAAERLGDRRALAYWTFYAGLLYDELGDSLGAKHEYSISLQLAQEVNALDIQGHVWRRLGWLAHIAGNPPEAARRYRQAIRLHQQAQDVLGQAQDWRQLGSLQLEQGEYDEAQTSLNISLDLVSAQESPAARRVQASNELDLAQIAVRQDRWYQAQDYLSLAEKHAQVGADIRIQMDVCRSLAQLAEERGDWQAADEQYHRQLELAQESEDWIGRSTALIDLGTLAAKRYQQRPPVENQRVDEQSPDYEQALRYYVAANRDADNLGKAVIKAQLGSLEYCRGEYAQANTLLTEALHAFQNMNLQLEVAGCLHQLGLIAQAMQQWTDAQQHYQASLNIRLKLQAGSEAVTSWYQLGTLAQERRQYDAARQYYRQALELGARCHSPNLDQIKAVLDSLAGVKDLTGGTR